MKKLIILAVLLIIAAPITKAQTIQSDTLEIIAQQIADANQRVAEINNALRSHAIMAEASVPITLLGAFLLATHPQRELIDDNGHIYIDTMHDVGLIATVVGCGVFVGSFTPLIFKKVKVNEKGLIVNL